MSYLSSSDGGESKRRWVGSGRQDEGGRWVGRKSVVGRSSPKNFGIRGEGEKKGKAQH
jgi:hypothetical protein